MNKLLQIRKYYGLTQMQIADLLSVGQNTISQIENDKISLTDKNKRILVERLHVNLDWLDTGRGEIVCDETEALAQLPKTKLSEQAVSIIKKTATQSAGVPFFDRPIVNGALEKVIDIMELKPDFLIDIKPFNDLTFYRPVSGDSMLPRFRTTDYVACKRSSQHNTIQFGETYLCIAKYNGQFLECLRVVRRHENPERVILRPLNSDFDEIVISINDIIELYIVKGVISKLF